MFNHVYIGEHVTPHIINARDGQDQGCPASNLLAPIRISDAHELSEQGTVFDLQHDAYLLVPLETVSDVFKSWCDHCSTYWHQSGRFENIGEKQAAVRHWQYWHNFAF